MCGESSIAPRDLHIRRSNVQQTIPLKNFIFNDRMWLESPHSRFPSSTIECARKSSHSGCASSAMECASESLHSEFLLWRSKPSRSSESTPLRRRPNMQGNLSTQDVAMECAVNLTTQDLPLLQTSKTTTWFSSR